MRIFIRYEKPIDSYLGPTNGRVRIAISNENAHLEIVFGGIRKKRIRFNVYINNTHNEVPLEELNYIDIHEGKFKNQKVMGYKIEEVVHTKQSKIALCERFSRS